MQMYFDMQLRYNCSWYFNLSANLRACNLAAYVVVSLRLQQI